MTKKSLIEFPCNFPVKIIGSNNEKLLDDVKNIIRTHFPEFNEQNISHKLSDKNNYLAITVTVIAIDQEMLDLFYRELTQHPDVKMVL